MNTLGTMKKSWRCTAKKLIDFFTTINDEEQTTSWWAYISWGVGLVATPLAMISEYFNPTTARAEAGIGAAYLWGMLMLGAVVSSVVSFIHTLTCRKSLRARFFWLGLSPFIGVVLLVLAVVVAVMIEDAKMSCGL